MPQKAKMNFSALFYREKEILKLNFWNLFLSYFGNFVFILSLLILFAEKNHNIYYMIIYFSVISQSQLFLYILNKIDEKEGVFDYEILTFGQQIRFVMMRFASIFILNLIFLVVIYFGLKEFYIHESEKLIDLYSLLLSNFIIILNTAIIYSITFFNKGRFIANFALLFLIPCNLPAIIFFVNSNYNLIYLVLMISFANLMIFSFFNKTR